MDSFVVLIIVASSVVSFTILAILLWFLYQQCLIYERTTRRDANIRDLRKTISFTLPNVLQSKPVFKIEEQQESHFLITDDSSAVVRPRSISVLPQYDQSRLLSPDVPGGMPPYGSHPEMFYITTPQKQSGRKSPVYPGGWSPALSRQPIAPRRFASMPDIFSPELLQAAQSSFSIDSESTRSVEFPDSLPGTTENYEAEEGSPDSSYQSMPKRRITDTRRSSSTKRVRTIVGKLAISTEYNHENNRLDIVILRAFVFPVFWTGGGLCPFVRLFLQPGKKGRQNTSVKKNTLQPEFNETIAFRNLSEEELPNFRAKFKLYSRRSIYRNDLIGTAELALNAVDFSRVETFSLDLMACHIRKLFGHMMISICHEATSSRLRVTIHKAKHLSVVGVRGAPDPYVSVMFTWPEGWERQQTKVKRRTRDPVFNEFFNFEVVTNSKIRLMNAP